MKKNCATAQRLLINSIFQQQNMNNFLSLLISFILYHNLQVVKYSNISKWVFKILY